MKKFFLDTNKPHNLYLNFIKSNSEHYCFVNNPIDADLQILTLDDEYGKMKILEYSDLKKPFMIYLERVANFEYSLDSVIRYFIFDKYIFFGSS